MLDFCREIATNQCIIEYSTEISQIQVVKRVDIHLNYKKFENGVTAMP